MFKSIQKGVEVYKKNYKSIKAISIHSKKNTATN